MQLSCHHLPCKVTATSNIILLLLHHLPLLSTAPHLSMEERVTLPIYTNNHNPHQDIVQVQVQQVEFAFRPGTYVVQVPKDQIYRVPPPENALIAERHRNTHQGNDNDNRWCCSRPWTWLLALVILVLVLGIIAGIVYMYLIKR